MLNQNSFRTQIIEIKSFSPPPSLRQSQSINPSLNLRPSSSPGIYPTKSNTPHWAQSSSWPNSKDSSSQPTKSNTPYWAQSSESLTKMESSHQLTKRQSRRPTLLLAFSPTNVIFSTFDDNFFGFKDGSAPSPHLDQSTPSTAHFHDNSTTGSTSVVKIDRNGGEYAST